MSTDYTAPVREMRFLLKHLAGIEAIAALPGCEETSLDLVDAILDEAGKFASGVLAPLNQTGDAQGCKLVGGRVLTPDGWPEAYRLLCEAGWVGVSLPTEYGGQGLPKAISTPVWEMLFSANLAFSMLPQLAVGETEALLLAASDELKARYVENVVTGRWAATMNLTEPQAGSDLAAVRTRAEPQADGTYRVFGQKIFISYGEHELAENIVHLVLARLPNAPPGVKGISMFLVPKFRVNADGSLGERNDIRCIAIEHKLGIHGSPTCALSFGDAGGAEGYLVGEPNRGLEYMFVMMNEARFAVGVQGVGVGERAYQQALAYARERVQSRIAVSGANGRPIVEHPDVKRMLLAMRARLLAARSLLTTAGGWYDIAHHHPDRAVADKHRRYIDLLMPIAKGWSTELGSQICDEAIQIHGGMGFVEETGIAQHLRDVRIIRIYEGTTGIQANDLIGRKILRERGATLRELIADMREVVVAMHARPSLADLATNFADAIDALERALDWVLAHGEQQLAQVLGVAVPFLHLLGTVCGSWQLGRLALVCEHELGAVASAEDPAYLRGLLDVVRFYDAHIAPQALAHARTVVRGGVAVAECSEAAL